MRIRVGANKFYAVHFIRNDLSRDDCLRFDLFTSDLPSAITQERWDYVVMGEILEHVDNPVSFLEAMKEKFAPHANSLIVTAKGNSHA